MSMYAEPQATNPADETPTTSGWEGLLDGDDESTEPQEPGASTASGHRAKRSHPAVEGEPRRARRRAPSGERKVVERTLAVAGLDEPGRDLLAAACGTDDTSVEELTLACLSAEAEAAAALALLVEVATADALTAGALAVGAAGERGGLRQAWAVLRRIRPDLPAQVPVKPVAAGTGFAGAAQQLTAGELDDLRHVAGILPAPSA